MKKADLPSEPTVETDKECNENIVSENIETIAFLFFKQWSNWFHVLHYLNVQNKCIRNEFRINQVLKDSYRSECVDLLFMLHQMKINSNAYTLILLEGSDDFVTSQFAGSIQNWVSLVVHRQLFLALIFTNRVRKFSPFKHLNWTKINHHKDAGGPKASAFQVAFYPKSSLVKRETETHKRFMSDFNKPTIRGLPTEPPVDLDALLKLPDVHNMHIAPCVFSATGWVYRRLSCPEVLRCIDIPQQMDKILFDKCASSLKSNIWSHILLTPPDKALIFLINSLPTFRFCTDKTRIEPRAKAEIKLDLQFKSIIQGDFISEGVLADKYRNSKAVKSDNAEVLLELCLQRDKTMLWK